ncbi:MAG TPA: hypothetical protein VME47_12655 [Acetobacteraceae bacterium]|nr:hypothetical protein [Acetobacteraceae bacterium]
MVEPGDSDTADGRGAVADGTCPGGERAAAGYFRIYLMDRENHIRSYRVISCLREEEAVAAAMLLLGEYPCVEVWNRARLVRRLTLRGGRRPDTAAQAP